MQGEGVPCDQVGKLAKNKGFGTKLTAPKQKAVPKKKAMVDQPGE